MKKLLVLIVLLIIFCQGVLSQNRTYLKVVLQEQHESKKSILRTQGNYTTDSLAVVQLESEIGKLRMNGYMEANIDSVVNSTDTVVAFVHLGKKYSIEKIIGKGLVRKDMNLFNYRSYNTKSTDWNEIIDSRQDIIEGLNNSGYPFAKVYMDSLNFDSTYMNGSWKLEKGQYFVWDSIVLKGNLNIKKNFLNKYLEIEANFPYNEKTFNDISNRVNNLTFSREIKSPKVEFIKNKAVLYTYLEKQKSNQFNGILGLQSNSDKKENMAVTGEINLLLDNAFRAGERIKLKWRKFESESQDLAVGFIYPYFISKLGVDFDFVMSKQDSSYLTTNLEMGFRVFQKGNRHVKLYYKLHASSLISTSHLSGVSVLPDYADVKSHIGGIGFEYLNLDYPLNPKRGWYLDFNLGLGSHRIEKNSKISEKLYEGIDLSGTIFNVGWSCEYNLPISNKISYRVKNKGGFIESPDLFTNDLFKLGGLSNLRGFDEDSFRASKFTVLTNEIRFIPERNTSFYLFFDAAYYRSEVVNITNDDFPLGMGFGLSFGTGSGIFSLNYALGKQESQNFDFRGAKIHFGFTSKF